MEPTEFNTGPEQEKMEREKGYALALYIQLIDFAIEAEKELKEAGVPPTLATITAHVTGRLKSERARNQLAIENQRDDTAYLTSLRLAPPLIDFARRWCFILCPSEERGS